MTAQTAFASIRKDRQHRAPKRPEPKQAQLFPLGKFIAPARKLGGDGGAIRLEVVETRSEYEIMREIHTGEIK